jgi:hypothetical protein
MIIKYNGVVSDVMGLLTRPKKHSLDTDALEPVYFAISTPPLYIEGNLHWRICAFMGSYMRDTKDFGPLTAKMNDRLRKFMLGPDNYMRFLWNVVRLSLRYSQYHVTMFLRRSDGPLQDTPALYMSCASIVTLAIDWVLSFQKLVLKVIKSLFPKVVANALTLFRKFSTKRVSDALYFMKPTLNYYIANILKQETERSTLELPGPPQEESKVKTRLRNIFYSSNSPVTRGICVVMFESFSDDQDDYNNFLIAERKGVSDTTFIQQQKGQHTITCSRATTQRKIQRQQPNTVRQQLNIVHPSWSQKYERHWIIT